MKRSLLAALLISILSGCGAVESMTEGFKHTQEVAADLEKSVGSKPFVGFNWHNGSLTNVNVTFEGIPAGKSTPEIVALAQSSIASRFKQQPKQVIVSFAVAGAEQ